MFHRRGTEAEARRMNTAMHEGTVPSDRIPMLIRGLRHAGLCVMYQDRTMTMRMVENPFESWPEASRILALGDRAIFDPATAEELVAAKSRVLDTGEPERIEARVRHESGDCWYALNIEPDFGARGVVRGLFVTASDITELKGREETLKGLLAELSHRSRNLLAIVQSILAHTARLASDPAEFAVKFRGRIRSLALTQDIITQANWRAAAFRQLVAAQIDPLADAAAYDIQVSGRDVRLNPTAALHVGLALHELATNSATYGVLRSRQGRITIAMDDSNGGLRFSWRESHAEPNAQPGLARFGSAVLSRALPQAVLGTAELAVDAEGVRYSLELPQGATA